MPNRHGQENTYKYGFNGMEKLDEMHDNSADSYDFGSRILDPRIGRWLSCDPLAARQADQSPFKAFLNNPIFWVDPNGKTEYQTVLITDEKTGKSIRMYVSKSNKLMTDGKVTSGREWPIKTRSQSYYDYAQVTKYTITTNGEILIKTYTEILYKNGSKYTDAVNLDEMFGTEAKDGAIFDPDDPFIQAGGLYMTSERGEGSKYYSKDPDYVGDIDDLLGAMTGPESASKMKKTPFIDKEELQEFVKHMWAATDHGKSLRKFAELFMPDDDVGIQSKKNTTAVICKPDNDANGGCEHDDASDGQVESGDTLGGKNPKTKKTNKCASLTR
jgi:RHS repeat-associated protein